jgi:sigma-B regulation protein RsbU (phosphoserine phosphatase)
MRLGNHSDGLRARTASGRFIIRAEAGLALVCEPVHTVSGMDEERRHFSNRDAVKLERLELALKASNEGIWDWWTDRGEIYYSRRILEFLECGKAHAPHLFLPPYEWIHPEDHARFQRAMDQALGRSGPETLAVDARVRTGGNDWRWLRIRGTVVRDRDGHTCRIAGSMMDISLRKTAEAQVEDERFLLRQLIDHIPVQIYFKDLASNFVMANKHMAEWVGLEYGSELAGKHDRDFFDEEHWKAAEADERRVIATGKPVTGQLEHEIWTDGGETWVVTSKFPWRDRAGNIKGSFGVSNDVTRIISAQRKATELAEELQEKNHSYEEELMLAREIQQAFATMEFSELCAGGLRFRFGSRYIPISGLAGDFFEVIPLPENRAGVLICDVMGHGVRSALVVAMLRGLLEKQRAQATDPGAFLCGLNEGLAAILERAGTTMFATAFYGLIDPSAGLFHFACAGHPGPVVEFVGGARQIAAGRDERGPALGLNRFADYPRQSLPLDGIRRLILFTDGVLEAENRQGEPFFEQRLVDIIGNRTGGTLEDLLDEILGSVLAFSEARHFDDDVCLLGVEILRE